MSTATTTRSRLDPATAPLGHRRASGIGLTPAGAAGTTVLLLAALAGAGLLVLSYRAAQWGTGEQYALFWAGMVTFVGPVVVVLCGRSPGPALRGALLLGFAAFTYLPKLLRNPAGPLYHDEYAHWRQSADLLGSGQLFEPNPLIAVVSRFPGLSATVSLIASATGVRVWTAALAVLVVVHCLAVVGVATLGMDIWREPRVACLAAVLYALNPSFLYFDTQLGYESLAIPVLIWTVVGFLRALQARTRTRRYGWSAVTIGLSAAIVVTHHLTALWLVAVFALVSTVVTVLRMRGPLPVAAVRTGWLLTLAAAALLAGWLIGVAPSTGEYLSPYLGEASGQLFTMARGSSSGRHLFGHSTAPSWEQAAAFCAPVIALVAFAGAVLAGWRARARVSWGTRVAAVAMGCLGAAYFPSLLFILAPSGAEGARRSWAVSYLGLALVVAPAAIAPVDRRAGRWYRIAWYRAVAGVVLLAGLLVVLVGNTAAGQNPSYRFPGPYTFGSDTRSVTPELLAASGWLRHADGDRLRIVTDRYTGLVFASYGGQDPAAPSRTFPTYDLYLARPGEPVPAPLLTRLTADDYTYLVVDRRLANHVPEIGVYFEPDEPFAHTDRSPFTRANLAKFDARPWTIKVYDSVDYAIYRFDFAAMRAPVASGAPARGRRP